MSSQTMSRRSDIWMKRLHSLVSGVNMNPTRMVLSEIVGTFVLVFCICGIIASTQLTRGEVGLLEYSATGGLTVVVVIFCIGPISGAHVNPAITIAFATFGLFPWSRVPFYVLAQTVGSILATLAGTAIYGIKSDLMVTRPLAGHTSAFWVELIATFIIVFLATALVYEAQHARHLGGFVIGIAIGLAVLITGPVSGGSMNPARSLGPAIVSLMFKDVWIYVTAPIIGAIGGALTYRVLRLQPPVSSSSSTSSHNTILLGHSMAFGES